MHKVLVIHKADLDAANEFCNSIGAVGDSFTVELFDSEDELAGYWCGWNMTDDQYNAVQNNIMFRVFDSPQEALQVTGWKPLESEG